MQGPALAALSGDRLASGSSDERPASETRLRRPVRPCLCAPAASRQSHLRESDSATGSAAAPPRSARTSAWRASAGGAPLTRAVPRTMSELPWA